MRGARFDDSGLDEIVADDVKTIYLDRMGKDVFSLTIEHNDGEVTSATLFAIGFHSQSHLIWW